MEKKCRKCGEVKDVIKFYVQNGKPYSPCKDCIKINVRNYYKTNKLKCQKTNKEWRESHPDLMKKYKEKWRKNNPDKLEQWAKLHPEKMREIKRKSRKKVYSENRRKILAKRCEYRKRYKRNPKYRLGNTMRRTIWEVLKGRKRGQHWESLVGYTITELKQHLESLFQEGMTWENYGKWHIDHIIPVSVFNFDHPDDIDFKRCWALENLQPMWAKENIAKHSKLSKHFQPMLKLKIG